MRELEPVGLIEACSAALKVVLSLVCAVIVVVYLFSGWFFAWLRKTDRLFSAVLFSCGVLIAFSIIALCQPTL